MNDLPVSDQLIPMDIRPNLDKTGIAINSLSYDYHIPCHSARVKHFLRRNQPLTWNSAQRRHEICKPSKMSKTMQNSHVFSKINTKKSLTVWYNKANKNNQRKG